MGDRLSDRRVRVAVDSFLISDLRVQFRVVKHLRRQPNTCDITISNLSQNSRAALQKKKRVKVILEAGYLSNIAQIFAGESRFVDQVLDHATWNTKIECGDGERAYSYARVAESFKPGTKVSDVVEAVAKQMGATVTGHIDELRATPEQFLNGFVAFGKTANELDTLLRSLGFTWSMQDGQVQVLQDAVASGEPVIRLAPDTGLIGSPEHGSPDKDVPLPQVSTSAEDVDFSFAAKKKQGPAVLKVRSLLQPGLRPGRRVQVQSRDVNGIFRIEQVTHSGDTAGGDWYSDLECYPAPSWQPSRTL